MKRYGNLYKEIYSMDNLILAHHNARKGKSWYREVKSVDANPDLYLKELQNLLITHAYQTSEYETFMKKEHGKEREIFKLPYFPDRICQWAVLQVIEPILMNFFTKDTYSAIPGRGIHKCLKDVNKAMQCDVPNCQYCLKMDARKFYPSINHDILKGIYRKLFKDKELLWLLDEIIDSTPGDTGIPIGNYLSQYSGNIYLTPFDHWIKEEKHMKYYFRYMDDVVIFSHSKKELHTLRKEIDEYFTEKLKLTVKENWQVFPSYVRGVDFVGYRTFMNFKLLRKSTCKDFKRKMKQINNKRLHGKQVSHSEWCAANSYKGWLIHCNSYRLQKKYIEPVQQYIDSYYLTQIKKGGKT